MSGIFSKKSPFQSKEIMVGIYILHVTITMATFSFKVTEFNLVLLYYKIWKYDIKIFLQQLKHFGELPKQIFCI